MLLVVSYSGLKIYSTVILPACVPRNSRIQCSRCPVTTTRRLKPCWFKQSTSRSRIDASLTIVRHLGMLLVRGYSRLPVPAARSNAVVTRLLLYLLFKFTYPLLNSCLIFIARLLWHCGFEVLTAFSYRSVRHTLSTLVTLSTYEPECEPSYVVRGSRSIPAGPYT